MEEIISCSHFYIHKDNNTVKENDKEKNEYLIKRNIYYNIYSHNKKVFIVFIGFDGQKGFRNRSRAF